MKYGAREFEMTNYDVFMLNKNKKKAQKKLFDRQHEVPTNISYENYKKKMDKQYTQEKKDGAYKGYLLSQLERTTPEKLLTEEEFYGEPRSRKERKHYSSDREIKISRPQAKKREDYRPSVMSRLFKKIFGEVEFRKGGKFFIAFYVLIVVAIASILIVMNTSSFSASTADATIVTDDNADTVQAMVVDNEKNESQNWFDKLCDSLN